MDGTPAPNPSYEIPIHNVIGSNEFKIQSKNLLEITENNRLTRCTYVSGANTNEYKLLCMASDMYVNDNQPTGTSYNKLTNGNLISCKYEEQIYFNTGNELFNKNFFTEFDENFISLGNYNKKMSSGSYTPIHSNCKYVTFRFGYGANAEAGTTYTLAPIVTKINDTSYVSHQEQNLPLDLRSKNLLENTASSRTLYGVDFTVNQDGTVKVNGTATHTIYFTLKNNITLKPGTFILSGCPTGGSLSTYYLALSIIGTSTQFVDTGNTHTRTLNESFTNVSYYIYIKEGTTVNNLIFKPQFEEGSTATDYVPYYNYELSKIGTAEDYFLKENGKWYLHKEVGKEVFDGSTDEAWVKSSNTDVDRFVINNNKYLNNSNSKCNYFIKGGLYTTVGIWTNNGGSQVVFNFSSPGTTTLEQWKQWLSTHNLEVIQPLQTSTKTEITETTLINQLEAIRKAQSYNDQTNINQTNEDLPFILDITALKK